MMSSTIALTSRSLCARRGLDTYARRMHATPYVAKSVKDKISEVADTVNKKVGQGLASAIETGEQATEKTKQTLKSSTKHAKQKGEEGKGRAEQIGQNAKSELNEAAAGAKKTTENVRKDL